MRRGPGGANVSIDYTAVMLGQAKVCDAYIRHAIVIGSMVMSSRIAKRKPPPLPATTRTSYHHGSLRAALIEATLRLIEEGGPEKVTVREAAKRAGVSSGAPFRHFPTKTALMTAVAEEAQRRLRIEIDRALNKTALDDPLARLRAIGTAYLRWAIRNPTHFQVVSTRNLIDYESSEFLRRDNDDIRALMDRLMDEAQRRGPLRSDDVTLIRLAGRALVYGLARMYVDGHFAQWGTGDEPERAMQKVLDLFIAALPKTETAIATARSSAPSISAPRSTARARRDR
jgi:AcrR family transcriptional regulator